MAFSDPNIDWRGTVGSGRGSSGESRPSVDSSVQFQMVIDSLYLKINELDRMNARIKKSIQVFGDLDQINRRKLKDLLNEALQMADQI